MSSSYTQNYHLNQWAPEDRILRADFNADNAKIDGAIAGKADQSALDALSQTVNTKADKSALNSLSSTVSGHTSSLARKGNCQIVFRNYTGTGTNGDGNPTVLTFSGKPLLVMVHNGRSSILAAQGTHTVFFRDGGSSDALSVSWSGWSMSLSSIKNAVAQMNAEGVTYTVIALIAVDA